MRSKGWASVSRSLTWTTLVRWASTSSCPCLSFSRTPWCSVSSTSSTPTEMGRLTLKVGRHRITSCFCQLNLSFALFFGCICLFVRGVFSSFIASFLIVATFKTDVCHFHVFIVLVSGLSSHLWCVFHLFRWPCSNGGGLQSLKGSLWAQCRTSVGNTRTEIVFSFCFLKVYGRKHTVF